jgi:hypothetical protein
MFDSHVVLFCSTSLFFHITVGGIGGRGPIIGNINVFLSDAALLPLKSKIIPVRYSKLPLANKA